MGRWRRGRPPSAPQAPNTLIAHKKLCSALAGLHAEKACIFTKQPLEMAIAALSAAIRRLLAKYRQIYEDERKLKIVKSKAKFDKRRG